MIYKTQEKFQNIVPIHSKHIERLLSILAGQKSIENKRKMCLMVYQTQEKFPKIISSHFVHSLRLLSIFGTPEVDRKQAQDMSDDISEPGKISKNYSEPFKAY